MCIQGNPKLREGHGQLETEIDVRRLGAAESTKSQSNQVNVIWEKRAQIPRAYDNIGYLAITFALNLKPPAISVAYDISCTIVLHFSTERDSTTTLPCAKLQTDWLN